MPSTKNYHPAPASERRSTIQKRAAASRGPPIAKPRIDIQPYMRSWEAEEDDVLIAAINELGCKWKAVASNLPGRSEAMCRNRYQRLMAPRKEGGKCTSRNRCTRCGEMKRGHTCRADSYVTVSPLPSPLFYDSLGLTCDIERPLCLPPPSPITLDGPGGVTMAMAAGAFDDLNAEEMEEGTEHEASSVASECADLLTELDHPASARRVSTPEAREEGGDAGGTHRTTRDQILTPTHKALELETRIVPGGSLSEDACTALADSEVAAALSIDPAAPLSADLPPLAPPALCALPLGSLMLGSGAPPTVGGSSSLERLLGSFDTLPLVPMASKQSSEALFLIDLVAQAQRAGGSPPPAFGSDPHGYEALPSLDISPPSFCRLVSLGALTS